MFIANFVHQHQSLPHNFTAQVRRFRVPQCQFFVGANGKAQIHIQMQITGNSQGTRRSNKPFHLEKYFLTISYKI
jgi:hypothetical protein